MYTTHGDHIEGTRLGDNPPLKRPRCGGVTVCPDCTLEAAAIPALDYSREEYYDEHTIVRIYRYLCQAGATPEIAHTAIATMTNGGILFRERK